MSTFPDSKVTKRIIDCTKFIESENTLFKFTPYNINALKIIINSELWFGQVNTQNDIVTFLNFRQLLIRD